MPQQKITSVEWLAKGKELFGEDFMKWRFVCPACGNVASIEDFRPFKDQGATTDSPTQQCIGRFTGGEWLGKDAKPGNTKPCNYVAFGLFHLSPLVVIMEDGKETQRFGFDGWPQSANGESRTDEKPRGERQQQKQARHW